MKKKYKILIIGLLVLILIWFIPIPSFIAFKIGLGDSVMGEAVSYAGIKPLQYRRFEMLKSVSSTNTLKRLYNSHPSATVKCYSFWALAERNEDTNHFELLKSGLTDDRKVNTFFGCFVSRTTVADFLISKSYNVISESDSLILDSLVLYSDKDLESKEALLMTLGPKEKYYNKILELAKNNSLPIAIVALAKYEKKKDVEFIIEELTDSANDPYYSLLAVKNFPHQAFIPYIIEYQQRMILKINEINHTAVRVLYKALVRYDQDIIGNKLEALIDLDNEIKHVNSLPDSIKVITKYESEFFNIEKDSSLYILESDYSKSNEYTIHAHLCALRLALLEYPDSKYQYLVERMKLENYELDMIKEELEFTNYE